MGYLPRRRVDTLLLFVAGMAPLVIALIYFLLFQNNTVLAQASSDQYTHYLDLKGGDCAAFGSWDSGSLTCSVTRDIQASGANGIVITRPSITLDGQGHNLNGSGYTGVAIDGARYSDGYTAAHHVTVKNLNISGFSVGIDATGRFAHDETIQANNISQNWIGVRLDRHPPPSDSPGTDNGSSYIEGNYIGHNSGSGILLIGSQNNVITGNTLEANGDFGIHMGYTAEYYCGHMYCIDFSSNNLTYGNNFIDNAIQAEVAAVSTDNRFEQPSPEGGNYWSDYDNTAEGCDDTDSDSFCDSPYSFTGGQDNLPRVAPLSLPAPSEPGWTGEIPAGIGNQLLYIANGRASEIKVVDVGQLQIVDTIPVHRANDGLAPYFYWEVQGVVPSSDRASVYATGILSGDWDGSKVYEMNAATGAELRGIELDQSLIGYGSLEYDRNDESSGNLIAANMAVGDNITANLEIILGIPHGYLPSQQGGWNEVDLATGTQTGFISTDYDGDTESCTTGIAWDSAGDRAYASLMYQPSIVTIDWNTRGLDGQVAAPVGVGNIHQSTTAKSRGLLFNAAGSDGIAIFDTGTENFVGSIDIDALTGSIAPAAYGVEIAPGNDDILYVIAHGVSGSGGSLLVVDVTNTNAPSLIGVMDGLDGSAAGVYAIADKQEYYGTLPGLTVSKDSVYWDSMADYENGILSVSYSVNNSGPDARDVSMVGTVNSAGVISVDTPTGAQDIAARSNGGFTVRYSVPSGVANFYTTVYAQAQNGAGIFEYPGPYPGS